MTVYVLFRFSKKTGAIDTTMTAINEPLLRMWAMSKTTKSKQTLIFNRDTGDCVARVTGTPDMPDIELKKTGADLKTCEYYGISLDDLQAITDDRFDK